MSDKYYRGLRNIINDTKYKLQLAPMTLKINENKNSISGIKNDISEINNFSDKINDNETSISDNLSKINDNTNDIVSNLGKINTNTSSILTNSGKISTNTKSISTNLEKIDNFTQYILQSGKDFEEKYIIEKQIFKFNKNKHFYTLFEKEIEFEFTKNSLLFVKNNIYYKYDDLSNDYHRLQHEYNIYDGDNLIHKYLFNKDTYYDESLDPILHTNEDFCICFKKNYNKIKINLQLHRHNRHGAGNINLEIDDDNENYISVDYIDRNNEGNNEQVDINTSDILDNSGKINTNTTDISSNLGKINDVKNNFKLYLKNIYNILVHDEKTQIDFKKDMLFYEKVFDINADINDFIEMNFKFQLEYQDTTDRNYVKMICELFDENDNSLYIKSVSLGYYNYTSIIMTVDENIFYNFTKDVKKIKFVIKFQKLSSSTFRVVKIWYIKNDNYRLILKHYGN